MCVKLVVAVFKCYKFSFSLSKKVFNGYHILASPLPSFLLVVTLSTGRGYLDRSACRATDFPSPLRSLLHIQPRNPLISPASYSVYYGAGSSTAVTSNTSMQVQFVSKPLMNNICLLSVVRLLI